MKKEVIKISFIEEYNKKALTDLERKIVSVYRKAIEETEEKAQEFFGRFFEKDKINRAKVASGEWTQAEYDGWVRGQIFRDVRYNAFIAEYQKMINAYDTQALDMVNDMSIAVFTNNANYVAYSAELASRSDDLFLLWDRFVVDEIIKGDKDLLPSLVLNESRNNAWNAKVIKEQITQGIIQGEGIEKISKRLQKVTDMNQVNARRNAITAHTEARGAGKFARIEQSNYKGYGAKKRWVTMRDRKVRDGHRELDGKIVDWDVPFEYDHVLNKKGDTEHVVLQFPAEATAARVGVYNCRCDIQEVFEDFPMGVVSQAAIENEKYGDWKDGLETGDEIELYESIREQAIAEWRAMKE